MKLATIPDAKAFKSLKPATDHGAKPKLRWIPVSSLRIDRAYQRDILEQGWASVRRIVENFKWSRFGTLLVSDRGDGLFAVVDGQHRTVAVTILGIEAVPCLVIEASQAEEAQAFAAINGAVTRLHPLQIFHARVVSGDKAAAAVQQLCLDSGVIVPRCPGLIGKVGETHAIGALQRALAQHGDKILGMALKAVVATGGGNVGNLKPAVIMGLPDALSCRRAWLRSQSALNAAIEHASISKMYATVERIRAVDGGSARALFAAQAGKALDREANKAA